jgi:hypothetical protein
MGDPEGVCEGEGILLGRRRYSSFQRSRREDVGGKVDGGRGFEHGCDDGGRVLEPLQRQGLES